MFTAGDRLFKGGWGNGQPRPGYAALFDAYAGERAPPERLHAGHAPSVPRAAGQSA